MLFLEHHVFYALLVVEVALADGVAVLFSPEPVDDVVACQVLPAAKSQLHCAISCQMAAPYCIWFEVNNGDCIICNDCVGSQGNLHPLPTGALFKKGEWYGF